MLGNFTDIEVERIEIIFGEFGGVRIQFDSVSCFACFLFPIEEHKFNILEVSCILIILITSNCSLPLSLLTSLSSNLLLSMSDSKTLTVNRLPSLIFTSIPISKETSVALPNAQCAKGHQD